MVPKTAMMRFASTSSGCKSMLQQGGGDSTLPCGTTSAWGSRQPAHHLGMEHLTQGVEEPKVLVWQVRRSWFFQRRKLVFGGCHPGGWKVEKGRRVIIAGTAPLYGFLAKAKPCFRKKNLKKEKHQLGSKKIAN